MPARNAHAFLVGISRYREPGELGQLRFADADVRGIAEVLGNPACGAFPPENVTVLANEDATRDAVAEFLKATLPARAKGAELVFVFFSGHGAVRAGRGDWPEGFFLPHDGSPSRLATSALSMRDLAKWLGRIRSRSLVVGFDCCHSALAWRGGPPVADVRAKGVAIEPRRASPQGRFILSSCGADERSVEVADWGHGLFSKVLIDGLRGAADRDRDGWVRSTELFTYVSDRVAQEAAVLGGRQTPWMKADVGEDVRLTRNAALGESGAAPPPADEACARWRRLLDSQLRLSGDAAVACARTHLDSRDRAEREAATQHLLQTRSADLLRAVFPLLHQDKRPALARRILRQLSAELVFQAIQRGLLHAEPEERRYALDAASFIHSSEGLVKLLDRLRPELPVAEREAVARLASRKRLSLERERLQGLFRKAGSPYHLTRALGQGLLTATFSATHPGTEQPLVLRVLRSEIAANEEVRTHFLSVARRCTSVIHQHLAYTREVGSLPDQGLFYVVREHLPGVTLREFLARHRQRDYRRVIKILYQIVAALQALHENGIVHGDLKPSNTFVVNRQDGSARIKIGDPGIRVRPETLFQLPMAEYDFRYVAPEVLKQGGEAGERSDFYSFGIMAYERFVGRPPFQGNDALEVAQRQRFEAAPPPVPEPKDAFSKQLNRMVLRLLNKEPAARHASTEELFRDLNFLAAGAHRPALAGAGAELDTRGGDSQSVVDVGTSTMQEVGTETDFPRAVQDLPPDAQPAPTSGIDEELYKFLATQGLLVMGRLGKGGMAYVYKCFHQGLARTDAVKIVLLDSSRRPEAGRRAVQEAKVMGQLNHPNLLQIYNLFQTDSFIALVMEYCGQGTLGGLLRRSGRLPMRRALEIARDVALGLAAAHGSGIVHRDVKPSNVLFSDSEVKLGDFGLATLREPHLGIVRDPTGLVMGTLLYMSPEAMLGQEVGPSSDLFSLGCTLFEMLTGKPPLAGVKGYTDAKIRLKDPLLGVIEKSGLTSRMKFLLAKLLARDPKDRVPGALELAQLIEDVLAGPEGGAGGRRGE
ncbi:MAG: protein kinase [Planctomycetes bacterium]|nr:protein kinase [Planctomycetota bacterium]